MTFPRNDAYLEIVALQDISIGEEITIDYLGVSMEASRDKRIQSLRCDQKVSKEIAET